MTVKPNATVSVESGELVIRIQAAAPAAAQDRLIALNADGCAAEGFELSGLQTLVRQGRLPTVKIGRHRYVRYSDLLQLPTAKAQFEPTTAPVAPPSGAYATALAEADSRRRRRAG